MNFEKPTSLYPERASSNLDASIARLRDLESGKIKKLELKEEEKAELLAFENSLGESLEKIIKIKSVSMDLQVDYLLTQDGIDDFSKTFALDIGGENAQTIERFIYEHRAGFLKIESTERAAFSGRAEKHSRKTLLDTLSATMTDDGEINITEISIPKQINLLLAPEKALEKLTLLRDFKRRLKLEIATIQQLPNISEPAEARLKILRLYQRKVNQILAENFFRGVIVQELANGIGVDNLTSEEKNLLELFNELSSPEKNYSRYDKFIHGATFGYDESGNKTQIPEELLDFAHKLDLESMEVELHKNDRLRERGLDPAKIFENSITCAEFSRVENSVLQHYNSLSAYPASTFNPDRVGPAPDGKWQFIALPEIEGMSTENDTKTIEAPSENQSVERMIAILCGHETEGHFIQTINREKIPLKLLASNHLGGDRTEIFAEGGAMMVQNIISEEAFGYKSLPGSHYVKAMVRKLQGGNYLDCVKTYYDSKKEFIEEKKRRDIINNTAFKKELIAALKTAISSSKRLFRLGVDKNAISPILAKSKDTVYLEQLILIDKLRQNGMEKYAFIGRVNLRTLADLAEIGLIDLAQIKKPDLYSLEIWNNIKDNYKLDSKNSPPTTLDK